MTDATPEPEAPSVRILGLLSWFDEAPVVLNQCLLGMKLAGVDHVVAVDGRYELYEHEQYVSQLSEQGAIAAICRNLGMGLTLYCPAGPWLGEVEKRTHLFTIALADAMPGDWFLVVDADVVVTKADDLKAKLAACPPGVDAASVTVRDMNAAAAQRADFPEYFDIRALFRAQPIRCEVNHHTYVTLDGRKLWTARGEGKEPEPALDLRGDVIIQHRQGSRPAERQLASKAYYETREELGVERGICAECERQGKEVKAVRRVPVKWERTKAGIVSTIEECCQLHIDKADERNHRRMRSWGILCACRDRRAGPDGLCKSCHKPIKADAAFRVIERNGQPQIGVRA